MPRTVAEFHMEATTIEKTLEQWARQCSRDINYAPANDFSGGQRSDMDALRELIRQQKIGPDDTCALQLKQFQQRSVKKTAKRRSSDTLSHHIEQEDQASSQQLDEQRVLSSTESLRQITLQLNGLMEDTNAALNGEMATLADSPSSVALRGDELLRRNQELATTLEALQQDRDQLEFQLQELKAKLARQQRDFDREREEIDEQSRREQGALKDQLQVHIQTIGILVAEKTELQSALSQSQQTAKQKAG
ncbi:hypothetical protein HPB51_029576 [Rhipicephalus microplus]|uniref:Uncharacterized protein n=1 Tax=Rhipicephalus microplus TaxID=6941 RepID=A0A9J6CU25_RHIMP|nr:hypothetical protein HPB51_029576 [Rhipicephalus microplus]